MKLFYEKKINFIQVPVVSYFYIPQSFPIINVHTVFGLGGPSVDYLGAEK